MLHRPKKRTWPSPSCRIWVNMRRQPPGESKGSKPSITSTNAKACQIDVPSKSYFFAGAAVPMPRIARKKSDDAGSSTITSPFLLKLAL